MTSGMFDPLKVSQLLSELGNLAGVPANNGRTLFEDRLSHIVRKQKGR